MTSKQERFCTEYLIDLNGAYAAIRAGYSKATAKQEAWKLLCLPEVQKKIEKLKLTRAKRLDIDADNVLKEFARIGFSDIRNYFNDDLSMKNLDGLADDQTAAIQKLKIKEYPKGGREIEFQLYNKLDALEKIGKHIGLFFETTVIETNKLPKEVIFETEEVSLN